MAKTTLDRRTILRGLSATAVAPMLPGCEGATSETATDPPDFGWALLRERIDTVVIVMMENRSFDHYLGARRLVEGDERVDGLTADMSNPHPEGGDVPVFATQTFCLEDPPHSWGTSREQFNEGRNDGFVSVFYDRHPEVAAEAMGYWTRETLSTLYALADAYTMCDQWFCSQLSSTWPNRFYLLCAQNGGKQGNRFPDAPFPSIFDRLDEAGYSWGDYFNNLPFAILTDSAYLGHDKLYDFQENFARDAAAGALPNVTLIEPVYGRSDDHPPNHPVAGQIFLSLIYDILSKSPQWERTLLVITYDEHGGFFDHVPPPTAPDDFAGQGFEQLGFRVPTLVVGPWVKADHVSSVTYDHTSILAFIENLFELDPLTARDAAADPMLDVFDQDALINNAPADPISLPVIIADEEELFAEECVYSFGFFAPPTEVDYHTGQKDLERFLDAHFPDAGLNRAHLSDELHDTLAAMAQARGLVRIKSR